MHHCSCFSALSSDCNSICVIHNFDYNYLFTGVSDKVVCFACGCGLRKWRPSADPWAEHARHSPDCQLVKEKKGEEFIQQTAQMTDVM